MRKFIVALFILTSLTTTVRAQGEISGWYYTFWKSKIMDYPASVLGLGVGMAFPVADHLSIEGGITGEGMLSVLETKREYFSMGEKLRDHIYTTHYGFGLDFKSKYFFVPFSNFSYFNLYTGSMFRLSNMVEQNEVLYTDYYDYDYGYWTSYNSYKGKSKISKPITQMALITGFTLGNEIVLDFFGGVQFIKLFHKQETDFIIPLNRSPFVFGLTILSRP